MVRAPSQRKDGIGSSKSKGAPPNTKDLLDLGISPTMQNANSSSKVSGGRGKNRKDMVASSNGPKDSSTLRRSAREFRMTISTTSNSNSRKSERLENQSLATPSKKVKIEREVKKLCQNSLRRSERIDKSSASGSSSSKKASNSSDSPVKKKGNVVTNGKKKSVLVAEGEVKSKNLNERTPLTGKKRKQMTARTYRALLSPQPAKKVRKSDSAGTQHECDSLAVNSETALEGGDGCCRKKISEQNVELCKKEIKEDAVCSSSGSKEDSEKTLGVEGDATSACVDAAPNLIKAVEPKYADNLEHFKCSNNSLQPTLGVISMEETLHDAFQRVLDGDDNDPDACEKNAEDLEIFKLKEFSFPHRSNCADTSRENEISPVASTSSLPTHYLDPDMDLTPNEKDKLAQGVPAEDVCLSTSSAKGENFEKCTKCVKLQRVQDMLAMDPCSCIAKRKNDLSFAPLEVVDKKFAPETLEIDANTMKEVEEKGSPLSKEELNGAKKPSCCVSPVCSTSVDGNMEKAIESPLCHIMGSSKKDVCSTLMKEQLVEIQTDCHPNACVFCKQPEAELFCCGKGCSIRYHISCLDPPLPNAPPGIWLCVSCIKRKIEFGVYSISEGIDSVWNVKEGGQNSKQYLVKYNGLAHVHNQWISETQMLQEAPSLLSKFNRKYQKNRVIRWKQEWTEPCRLLQKRLLMAQELADQFFDRLGNNFTKCYCEWYVKWKGLGYEDATWELESSPFLHTPEALSLMKDYEVRLNGKAAFDSSNGDKALEFRRNPFHKLARLPDGCPRGLHNRHLDSINKLREFWHRSQNTLFIDDQERVIISILLIMSLQSYACRPFLIICPSTSLSVWESEFHRLAPSINLIVYNGTKHARNVIQNLEFYEDGGRIMFQVLVSHVDAILEDFDKLECIGWEALFVDDGQNSKISKHLECLKRFSTGFRLLLLSDMVKDKIAEYLNLLSFLDSGIDKNSAFATSSVSNDAIDTLTLKERLSHYVAYERKPDSSNFLEYWIPVHLSNVQLEQYCATLISSTMSLRSCSKDLVGALGDILISTRKCCDHPYLVDDNLQGSLTRDLQVTEYLDIGVNASGKLQVLDKILQMVKDQGLRVIILFQTIGRTGKISIGDILDDFLRQRFGAESYERVDQGLIMSKRLAVLNKFNDRTSGRFVFLIENRACLPSIKVSSVDAIIIYDSDWNPLNDLRSLQKLTIESQNDQILVLRLYSSFTVEEKLLVLAKQNMLRDNKIENVNPNVCHSLLSWGASYLFHKLDEFHQPDYSDKSTEDSPDKMLLINDVKELLSYVPDYASCECSIIVKAQQSGPSYSGNIILVGEKGGASSLVNDPPRFWSNLLDGRYPEWRYVSDPFRSHRSCRKVHSLNDSAKQPEPENDELKRRKNKEVSGSAVGRISSSSLPLGREAEGKNTLLSGNPIRPSIRSLTRTAIVPDSLLTKTVVAEVHSTSQQNSVLHGSPVSGGTSDDTHEIDSEVGEKLRTAQGNLHLLLKPQLSELCEILKLPENVKDMTQLFLEYIMHNHHVSPEPEIILQAFKISLCWRAASFLKHKIDHEESLALARKYLNFMCDGEQASNIYSKLRILKKKFSQKDGAAREKYEPDLLEHQPPSYGADLTEEHVFKMSLNSSGHVSELEKGEPSEDLGQSVLEQLIMPEQEQVPTYATHTDFQEHPGSGNDEFIRNQINLINKICSRREADLFVKQHKEILDFNIDKEKMEMSLKKEYEKGIEPFLLVNDSAEKDHNIRLYSEIFSKKMAALGNHMSLQYQKLKNMQSVAKDKECQIKNHGLEEAKAGKLEAVKLVEFFQNIPLSDSGFTLEEFKVLGQDNSHDDLEIGTYESNTTGPFQNEQTGNVLTVCNLVSTELPSKNSEVAAVSSPGVAGCLSGQYDIFISQSNSMDEVLRDMSLEVPHSVPFSDMIDMNMDTDALASELPIMGIVTNVVDGMATNRGTAITDKQGFEDDSERSCLRTCPSQNIDQGTHMDNCDGACLATFSTENQELCIDEHERTENSPVLDGQRIGSSQEIPTSNSSDFLNFEDELTTNNISVSDYFDNPLPVDRVPVFAHCEDSIAASRIQQEPSGQMSSSLQNDMPVSGLAMLSSDLEQSNHSFVPQIVDHSILQNSHIRMQRSIGDVTDVSRQPESNCYPLFPLIQLMPTRNLQPEPLKNELARIRMHGDRIGKMHEDMKLKLKLECEQELLKVRKKYDMLLQDAESEYVQCKEMLGTIYSKVFMNQVLAEEFRAKFVENKGRSSLTSQGQRSLHHLPQASQPQFVQRAALSTTSVSSSLPVTHPATAIPLPVSHPAVANLPSDMLLSAANSLPVTHPSATIPLPVTFPATANLPPATHPSASSMLPVTHPSATIPSASSMLPDTHPSAAQSNLLTSLRLRAPSIPSGQTVCRTSSVFSSNSVRPHFGSMLPTKTNIQGGSETRAPAPHLQRFRANASLTSPSIVHTSRASQHYPLANIGSAAMGQVAANPNLQPCFVPTSEPGQPAFLNSLPVFQDVSLSSVGLPLDVRDTSVGANQQSSFQIADLVPMFDRSSSKLPSRTSGLPQSSADVDRHSANSGVVCISDDES
ncbi:uncharacterized protein LOC122051558 isoform X1 [Zingiber officinale]|uniref:uncharacterized protein LOC122051558 isoform X1 n=2 Tax=Zingiber officinale TaxID=94328 RepID=UPI001C4A8CEB|nr:uncharacterized protein LOC122051558 isoform X1 [Zingiber officinale]